MGLFSHIADSSRGGEPASPIRPPTRAILIVEDEPLVAFDNEYALVQAGYRVVDTVDRYGDALEAMEGAVDLVIADIRLPGKRNGIDVARHAASRGIAVLFATVRCPPEAQGHAVGWLAKPYAPRDLVRAIAVVDAVLAGEEPRFIPETLSLFPAIPAP